MLKPTVNSHRILSDEDLLTERTVDRGLLGRCSCKLFGCLHERSRQGLHMVMQVLQYLRGGGDVGCTLQSVFESRQKLLLGMLHHPARHGKGSSCPNFSCGNVC